MSIAQQAARVERAKRSEAFRSEIARCDSRFDAAKARGDEHAAAHWSRQRTAAIKLLCLVRAQPTQADLLDLAAFKAEPRRFTAQPITGFGALA